MPHRIQLFVLVAILCVCSTLAHTFSFQSGGKGAGSNYPAIYPPSLLAHTPSARCNGTSWTYGDYLYVFGGKQDSTELRNDLWRLNMVTGIWTFLGGPKTNNEYGIYEALIGVTPWPGAREGGVTWWSGRSLYMFGGRGYATSGRPGYLNDLWRYDLMTGDWTFLSGSSSTNAKGVYGGFNMVPGSRYAAVSFRSIDNKFYLYGGKGYNSASSGTLGDMWKYDLTTNKWAFISGSSSLNQVPTQNVPGAKMSAHAWTDSNTGLFYLFGGLGGCYGPNGPTVNGMSDLWSYTPATLTWTRLTGSPLCSQPGKWSQPNAYISARYNGLTWFDSARRNLIQFGGVAMDIYNQYGYMRDVWGYNLDTKVWTFYTGNTARDQHSIYGPSGVASSRAGVMGGPDNRNSSRMWFFGGYGYVSIGTYDYSQEVWTYNF